MMTNVQLPVKTKVENMNPQSQMNMTPDQSKILGQMEDMLIDTFERMKKSCTAKCLKRNMDESHVMKNEAVCIDRCVAKYMDVHDMVGKRIAKDKETFDLLSARPYDENEKES